jgi:peptidoglycan LD-endopeptidase CwlK
MFNKEKMHPYLKVLYSTLVSGCDAKGIHIVGTSGYRTFEEQNELYAQGRTKSGNIVTNCKAGQGMHEYGLAFDIVVLKNGKADWNDLKAYAMVGKIGKNIGLVIGKKYNKTKLASFLSPVWGGDWKKFVDRPHFEWLGGLTYTQVRNGMRPKNPLTKV